MTAIKIIVTHLISPKYLLIKQVIALLEAMSEITVIECQIEEFKLIF